jgi:hypothetical protein
MEPGVYVIYLSYMWLLYHQQDHQCYADSVLQISIGAMVKNSWSIIINVLILLFETVKALAI